MRARAPSSHWLLPCWCPAAAGAGCCRTAHGSGAARAGDPGASSGAPTGAGGACWVGRCSASLRLPRRWTCCSRPSEGSRGAQSDGWHAEHPPCVAACQRGRAADATHGKGVARAAQAIAAPEALHASRTIARQLVCTTEQQRWAAPAPVPGSYGHKSVRPVILGDAAAQQAAAHLRGSKSRCWW